MYAPNEPCTRAQKHPHTDQIDVTRSIDPMSKARQLSKRIDPQLDRDHDRSPEFEAVRVRTLDE
jgi:hypothetical protein